MRNYRVYLRDILDCINRIDKFTKGIPYSEFIKMKPENAVKKMMDVK
ncbi:MAG: hypothetical protein HPY66_3635 [Firmicutes bacterium]|nr:hypothetical protein [Bacillota bacterium]